MFRFLIVIGIAMLALAAAERLISVPPSGLWRAQASDEACVVYRALLDSLPYKDSAFVRSGTAPWSGWAIDEDGDQDSALRGPGTFQRVDRDSSGSREDLRVNTTAFVAELQSSEPMLLRRCFEGASGPAFFDGPGQWFYVREGALAYAGLRDANLALYEISPIGFSSDGRYALLHLTSICYGLCGSGVFFLFEKREGSWELAGTAVNWIS